MAVAGEDGYSVAVVMLRGKANRFLEILCSDHLQDRAENLVLVALHVGRDVVEEGRSYEEAFLMALQRKAAAVDDELGALVDAHLDVLLDALLVRHADHRAVVGLWIRRDADPQALDRRDQLLAKRVRGFLTD